MAMNIKSVFLTGELINLENISYFRCHIDIDHHGRKSDAYMHVEDIFILIFEAQKLGLKSFVILKNDTVKTLLREAASSSKVGIGYTDLIYTDGTVVVAR